MTIRMAIMTVALISGIRVSARADFAGGKSHILNYNPLDEISHMLATIDRVLQAIIYLLHDNDGRHVKRASEQIGSRLAIDVVTLSFEVSNFQQMILDVAGPIDYRHQQLQLLGHLLNDT